MDTGLCTRDGITYTAEQFSNLPYNDLQIKRRHLICPECKGPGFFRQASRSGQAACFGARPHKDNCNLAASLGEVNNQGLGEDQDAQYNPGQRIVLDLNYGGLEGPVHNDPDLETNDTGRGGRYAGDGNRPNAVSHRRLSTILRNLIHSDEFRNSYQTIEIPGLGESRIVDFFIKFDNLTNDYIGKFKGYWGMISDAGIGNGAIWLNSGGIDDVSICIPDDLSLTLRDRFKIKDMEYFSGKYALVLGELSLSKNNKAYIHPEDLNLIVLI